MMSITGKLASAWVDAKNLQARLEDIYPGERLNSLVVQTATLVLGIETELEYQKEREDTKSV